jgi:PAS domain S-box-containing protein
MNAMPPPPSPPAAAGLGHLLAWQPRGAVQWLALNVAAALAYWLAARLGAALAVGNPSASVLWPPNGLALALLMAWGWRVLPGLLAGSLVSVLLTAIEQQLGLMQGYLVPTLVRLGSAAQWLLACHLLGDWRAALRRPGSRPALHFVLTVLGCCLIAPSAGLTTLLAVGRVTAQELPAAWLVWWVGDAAGMLVLAPLLLTALHPEMRRHMVANQTLLTLSLGLGLTLAATALLGHQERMSTQARARAELRAFSQDLSNQMALAVADLEVLAAQHYRIRLQLAEFERTATRLRSAHDWVSGFAYLPRVPGPEREAFERDIDQGLRALAADGSLRRAPVADLHWPVGRLSPLGGQETRLGVDEISDPVRRKAIEAALTKRRPVATGIVDNLLYASNDEWGLLLYTPVFESAQGEAGEATGLVSASVGVETLLRAALAAGPGPEFPLLLTAAQSPTRGVLVQGRSLQGLDPRQLQDWLKAQAERDLVRLPLRLGDTQWQLSARLSAGGPLPRPGLMQATTFGVGLGCTGLLGALLAIRARRDEVLRRWSEDLSAEVARATAALTQANQQLQREGQERERVAADLRRYAQQLIEREALLSALLGHMPDPVWLCDAQGRFRVANRAAGQFLGWRSDALIGYAVSEVMSAGDAQSLLEANAQALREPGAVVQEIRARNAKGRELQMMRVCVAVHDAGKRLLGVLGLSWDVSEDRRRERALQRFRWLADSAAQAFALARLDGRVEYLNATALNWLAEPDWQEGQVRHARRYFSAQTWRQLLDEVMPQARSEGHWSGLLPIQDRHGQPRRDLLGNLFLLRDEAGEARFVALLLTDIGERLALEAELAQSRDRAEDANRAKSVFLSNISHEIRTPLNAVLGYAQLLEEHEGLDAGARPQVHAIHQAGKRLLGLINDVLDLSKIEAGALQLRPEPLELHSELAELHALMKARATQQGLRFELQRHFDAPCPALLDRGKFGQVLLNLLGNAIKFTPAGGTVRLIARVEPTPSGSRRLDLRVEDDGPGIAADERAQLFQPFRQGRSGERKGGTGLGLALSRKLVEAMGGELGMDSAPGQGTQAHLHLPLPMPEAGWSGCSRAPREAALQWRLAAGRRCRVLVAEDDDDSRQLLVELLQRLGCEVAAGADGQLALELARQHDYDIVLSDMRMPVLDGIGLRAALAAEPRSRDWPVVAVTASSLTMNREDFLRLGFAEHIGKPYTFDEVLGVLRRLAGAIFERRQPAPADSMQAVEPASDAQAGGPPQAGAVGAQASSDRRPPAAALRQGLELAREGRAGELRGWLREQTELPPAMQQAIEQALARYDLQAAEQLLQTLIEE